MIFNSGSDENGKYSGGKAGDQTGGECAIRTWYSRPWTEAWEPPSRVVGEELAKLARNAAANDHIGYDQGNRLSFYNALMKASNYDPANISSDVEQDCSAGVAALVAAVGKRLGMAKMAALSSSLTTWTLGAALQAAGWKRHTDPKYLTSDKYVGKGWILNNTQHHVAINVTDGTGFSPSVQKPRFRFKTPCTTYVRSCMRYASWNHLRTLPKGTTVYISGVVKGKSYWWGILSDGTGYVRLGTVKAGVKYALPIGKWLRKSRLKSAKNHIRLLDKGKTVVLGGFFKGKKYWWGTLADGSGHILLD